MTLVRDQMEPLAREIAHFLVLTKAARGSRWYHSGGYNREEDLIPLKQQTNDDVSYIREKQSEARIRLYNIVEQAPDPSSIVIHPEIVLASKPRAGATITIDNRDLGIPSEPHTFTQEFRDGESEANAVSASITNETWATASASAKVEAGPASAEASVETGVRNTIEAAWERQTNRSRESTTGGIFPFRAPAHTMIQARMEWAEQTKQRRIECDAIMDCAIEIGRRSKHGWNSKSPARWESIDHLIAVAEKRGRVEHFGYEHFAGMTLNEEQLDSLGRIKKLRLRKVDKLTDAFTGNADIKIAIVNMESVVEDEGE